MPTLKYPDPVIKDLQQGILSFGPRALPDLAHPNAAQIIQGVLEPALVAVHGGRSWYPSSVFDLDNLGYSVAHVPTADTQDYERKVDLGWQDEGTGATAKAGTPRSVDLPNL
ncbi:hypothetical protein DL766_001022 [Monosporascus sp. MC13-8B]|uniref:Uncharacterized protein n=1 Tax=Monosporascus cannonballus TaxID=155416 RepID=A0ABY0H7T6_9PEZI|nr:hypothetical protein DL763_010666 [Monosporascus cannonballus]RYO86365.1 hypothetical protein DL762_004781 [Monosporascus cannonballus]RYP38313.1 hypothetical protein DL766_001022 [Monosporascus sp. MC13-8B]